MGKSTTMFNSKLLVDQRVKRWREIGQNLRSRSESFKTQIEVPRASPGVPWYPAFNILQELALSMWQLPSDFDEKIYIPENLWEHINIYQWWLQLLIQGFQVIFRSHPTSFSAKSLCLGTRMMP